MISKLKSLFKYLTHGIWHENLDDLTKKRLRGIRFLRISMLIGNGFAKDQCALHASSLTFISLLSFVPVLTICFIFANMMGATEMLHTETKDLVRRIAEAPLPLQEEITKLANGVQEDVATTNEVANVDILDVIPENDVIIASTQDVVNNEVAPSLSQTEVTDTYTMPAPVQVYSQSNIPQSNISVNCKLHIYQIFSVIYP